MSAYEIGATAILVVGVEGIVTARTDDTVTIAGHALPRHLEGGVRYLSMGWPTDQDCDLDHCRDHDPPPACDETHDEIARLADAIEEWHDAEHSGPLRTCQAVICREITEVTR